MTRRVLISLCPATFLGFRVSALAADPWTAKKPADWTEKDRSSILTKSPWAKQASPQRVRRHPHYKQVTLPPRSVLRAVT